MNRERSYFAGPTQRLAAGVVINLLALTGVSPALSAGTVVAGAAGTAGKQVEAAAKVGEGRPGAQRNAAHVACHYTYGGETHTLRAEPVSSPYAVEPVAVGSYFQLRVVFEDRPAAHAAVKIYTYADRDEGLVPIHVGHYPLRQVVASGRGGFTGQQFVYEPMRDGELIYWCEYRPARRTSQ